MKKRITALLLTVIMLTCVFPISASAASSLSNFTKVNAYTDGQFSDVPSGAWYAENVQLAYELGLVNGKSESTFEPESNLTLAEAIKLAACLHSIYNTGEVTLENGTPWYRTYADYALENGLIQSEYSNYDALALRSDFASIFAAALPAEALTQINDIADGAIPDVLATYSYGPAVYQLYRAGILTGSDAKGTFYPNSNIRRSEVATIASRMADVSYRKPLTLASGTQTPDTQTPDTTNRALSATEISEKCSSAVFFIEALNTAGKPYATGSGFFLDSNGMAVTNYHVVKGATSARITTTDGKVYPVEGVYDHSVANDLVLIKISGEGFPYLEAGDSSVIKSGETVYTIGSPLGYQNTITMGIVSSAARTFEGDDVKYIQIDAAISQGSSGGALINTAGKVIGVTSAYIVGGQNMNLAIPISYVHALKMNPLVALQSIMPKVSFYASYSSVPDYGALIDAPVYRSYSDSESAGFFYRSRDSKYEYLDDELGDYGDVLLQNNFEYIGTHTEDGDYFHVFENEKYGILFGPTYVDGILGVLVVIVFR